MQGQKRAKVNKKEERLLLQEVKGAMCNIQLVKDILRCAEIAAS